MQDFLDSIDHTLKLLAKDQPKTYQKAEAILRHTNIEMLSHGPANYEVLLNLEDGDVEILLCQKETSLRFERNGKSVALTEITAAAAMHVLANAACFDGPDDIEEGRTYTREGMMYRVLHERRQKAVKAPYKIKFANNVFGEHLLTNEHGKTYRITLRDFDNETGYIDNPDWKFNKLGTTKHIMFAFATLREKPALLKKMSRQYPFVEIYTNPLNEYRITWYYPHPLPAGIKKLISKFFNKSAFIPNEEVNDFLLFLKAAKDYPEILIRPEVEEKVNQAWEAEMLQRVKADTKPDFGMIKQMLFPYEQAGVEFATFKSGAFQNWVIPS